MHAVGFDVIGGPEVLRPVELPVPGARRGPGPGPGGVRGRQLRRGPAPARRLRRTRRGTEVPGLEVSGEVAALGDGVTGLAVGDPVAAYLPDGGGYAEYALAPAEFAFPLDGISLRDGGGAALVLTTAYGVLAGAAGWPRATPS